MSTDGGGLLGQDWRSPGVCLGRGTLTQRALVRTGPCPLRAKPQHQLSARRQLAQPVKGISNISHFQQNTVDKAAVRSQQSCRRLPENHYVNVIARSHKIVVYQCCLTCCIVRSVTSHAAAPQPLPCDSTAKPMQAAAAAKPTSGLFQTARMLDRTPDRTAR